MTHHGLMPRPLSVLEVPFHQTFLVVTVDNPSGF